MGTPQVRAFTDEEESGCECHCQQLSTLWPNTQKLLSVGMRMEVNAATSGGTLA